MKDTEVRCVQCRRLVDLRIEEYHSEEDSSGVRHYWCLLCWLGPIWGLFD